MVQSIDRSPRRGRPLRFEALEERTPLAVNVVPTVETADASGADDAAIWIHPTDPAQSTLIGAIKTSANALRVYNLAGQELQRVDSGRVNNVDLRYNFPLAGQSVALVAGSNRSNDSLVLYQVNPQTGLLANVAARTISTGINVYGCAMYVSPVTGKYYVFVSSESGQVQQWELAATPAGTVDATLVRSFSVGSITEGLVADDVLGHLYVGEENVGIWKYSAEPNGGSARTRVDSTGSGGNLDADVEGLTIYYAPDGVGYLIASSQGNNQFVVYRREGNNAYLGSFALVAGGGIDAVSDTDGIDVTNFPLGDAFPQGMFVAQDNDQNFKLARWDAIAAAFGGLLEVDTSWDPRLIGRRVSPPDLLGDYNFDGAVDAGDYVTWRNTLGDLVDEYDGADGSGNGIVDAADYLVWKSRYGVRATPGRGGLADSLPSAYGEAIPMGNPPQRSLPGAAESLRCHLRRHEPPRPPAGGVSLRLAHLSREQIERGALRNDGRDVRMRRLVDDDYESNEDSRRAKHFELAFAAFDGC